MYLARSEGMYFARSEGSVLYLARSEGFCNWSGVRGILYYRSELKCWSAMYLARSEGMYFARIEGFVLYLARSEGFVLGQERGSVLGQE
jgi:hypothetical protein